LPTDNDSSRAWNLLVDRLRLIEQALNRAEELDAQAWRDYRQERRECIEAHDKAMAALKADIETLRRILARRSRTPNWQKALWALGTALGAALVARLAGLSEASLSALIRWLSGAG